MQRGRSISVQRRTLHGLVYLAMFLSLGHQLIGRAQGMKRVLERGLKCECLRIEDCVLVGGGAPDTPAR
jgi:hypothetical protein